MHENIQVQLSHGRTDQAGGALHISKSFPPPTAAEIDLRHEIALHRDTARKIQVDIEESFPNDGKTRYSSVYVLLLCWADEEPKLPVSLELDRLQDVFLGRYGFSTEKWEIPHESSHNKLAAKIMDFIELGGDSRRDLKIIYYGGHGMLNKGRQPVWMNLPDTKHKAFRQVVWGGIQTNLEQAQSDVLILLDCCESGTANTDFGCGTTELIAACGFDAIANPVGSDSFTHSLIEELIGLSGEASFTVSLLYNNILSRLSKWMPDLSGVKRKSPVHVTLTQNSQLPRPIQLSPRLLSLAASSRPTVFVEESSTFCQSPLVPNLNEKTDWSLGACLASIPDMSYNSDLQGLPRLAVNIWLQKRMSSVDLQVETMGDWIRMMPVLAQRVQIGSGAVDYCNLFRFIQETFLDALRQNTENSLPAMKTQVSLTQATLEAASTALDEMMAQNRETRAAAERLQKAVSQGLADVSVEIRAQGDKVAESATAISNSLDTGFKSLSEGLSKQGEDIVASSERIERAVKTGLEGTAQSLRTLLPRMYDDYPADRLRSLQFLLEYDEDTILEGTGVAGFLTVENEQVPVFGYLSPTEDWRINWEQMPYCNSERMFGETDRTMLLDPEGKRIKVAIADGKECVAFHPEFVIDKKPYLIGPLHSLFLQASRSHLYPRTPCWLFDDRGNRRLEVSPSRYAQDLGKMDLWRKGLEMAGWDEADIQLLIDDQINAGVSDLPSGTVLYLDRDTCRRTFVRRLRAGYFRGMTDEMLDDECKTLQFNLGLWGCQSIVETVQISSIEYFIRLAKTVPGGWLEDGEAEDFLREPIPGVDHPLPQWSIEGDLIDWSKYLDDNDTQEVKGNDMGEEWTNEDHLQEDAEDDEDEDEYWHDALSNEAEITGATQR
ncbi:hypothetical protein IFR05_007031 [Cadophora sp. M221]|nr:hypothetical protein IFR05_007031 [Cadophora sp. M221]